MKEAGPGQVKSAIRALDIVEYTIARGAPFAAQEAASVLGIPLSSMSYLLATLVEREYLVKVGRRYSRGPSLDRLTSSSGAVTLADRLMPIVRSLRTRLDETTSFFVKIGWQAEAVVTETSEQALRYSVAQNSREPLHALAAGKAILAQLDEATLADYFRTAPREKLMPQTVTDETALRAQIAEVRETGLARSIEEFTPGIAAIACPVAIEGYEPASLSVAIPLVRLDNATYRRVVDLLREAARSFPVG